MMTAETAGVGFGSGQWKPILVTTPAIGGYRNFFVGVAKGGLNNSEGVLKNLIKLRESNERLNQWFSTHEPHTAHHESKCGPPCWT